MCCVVCCDVVMFLGLSCGRKDEAALAGLGGGRQLSGEVGPCGRGVNGKCVAEEKELINCSVMSVQ